MNIRCRSCNSQRIWKDGIRQTRRGEVQRYICRTCGLRFSETTWSDSDESEHVERVHTTSFHSDQALLFNRRVGAYRSRGEKLGLNARERNALALQEKAEASDEQTPLNQTLLNFGLHLMRQGLTERTIAAQVSLLRLLINYGANLYDPESVKDVIAKQKSWCEGSKRNAVVAYSSFIKMIGGRWEPPKYAYEEKLPFIPLEQEIDQLIAGCGKKMAVKLQVAKETAARIGEILAIKWCDVDFATKTLRINQPEKHSLPRICRISDKLVNMLNALPRKSERVFGNISVICCTKLLAYQRKQVANKLQNPRINQIHFHTLRHWKATMEAHRTKDPFYVQQLLGHKNIKNTMKYIHLAQILFKETNDDFTCRVAKNIEEAKQLIEVGFDFVHEFNGVMLFRKRK